MYGLVTFEQFIANYDCNMLPVMLFLEILPTILSSTIAFL
jgi:hypothetical protein